MRVDPNRSLQSPEMWRTSLCVYPCMPNATIVMLQESGKGPLIPGRIDISNVLGAMNVRPIPYGGNILKRQTALTLFCRSAFDVLLASAMRVEFRPT